MGMGTPTHVWIPLQLALTSTPSDITVPVPMMQDLMERSQHVIFLTIESTRDSFGWRSSCGRGRGRSKYAVVHPSVTPWFRGPLLNLQA